MRIHVLSDLHQEFGEVDVPSVDCDCVILAGDVAIKRNGLKWIRRRFTDVPVIYICGNHEYYSEKFPRLADQLREEARGTNIHFLENEAVTIGGFHFFGCTLWTDMALHGDWMACALEAGLTMNDYKRIRNSDRDFRRLSPQTTRHAHLASLQAMREFFAGHEAERTIVVTHHAPSVLSLPVDQRAELVSCAYASRLDDFIEEHHPRLWIHGHIHHSHDYRIGRTRVISNPRGYPDDPNEDFAADFVITLEA